MNWDLRYKISHFHDIGHPLPKHGPGMLDHFISHHAKAWERMRELFRDEGIPEELHIPIAIGILDRNIDEARSDHLEDHEQHPGGIAGNHPHHHHEETDLFEGIEDFLPAFTSSYHADPYDQASANLTSLLNSYDEKTATSADHIAIADAHTAMADEAAKLARGGQRGFWNVVKRHNTFAKKQRALASKKKAAENRRKKKINPNQTTMF